MLLFAPWTVHAWFYSAIGFAFWINSIHFAHENPRKCPPPTHALYIDNLTMQKEMGRGIEWSEELYDKRYEEFIYKNHGGLNVRNHTVQALFDKKS